MGAVVALLGADNLTVEPGQTVTADLSIGNNGTIVEQFTILVLGDAAEWTESEPPVVSLFPGAQQTVTLRFSPPRAYTTPSGPVPYGVKVIPSTEPEESVTEEGELTVGSFNDVGAELVPRVATGRLSGHQKLAVDSRGNVPLPVAITAIDGADALKFRIRPDKVTTAPGEARYIKMRIKPRQRFWKGPNQQKPYKVQVEAQHERPLVLDGALTQKSVLPKWFLPALAILAGLVLLWFLVLKPIVHNDAVNANKAALASQQAQTKALADQVAAANQTAQQANTKANLAAAAALAGKKPAAATTTTTTTTVPKVVAKVAAPTTTTSTTKPTAPTTPPPVTPTTQPAPVTGPNDGTMEVITAPNTLNSNAITIAAQNTLQITTIVLENVTGGSGTALLQRVPATPGQPAVPLLREDLNTLTDMEYQFNSPMVLTAGEQLMLTVHCNRAQEVAANCEVNLYYTGPLTHPAP
jgi:hypothetical protein